MTRTPACTHVVCIMTVNNILTLVIRSGETQEYIADGALVRILSSSLNG